MYTSHNLLWPKIKSRWLHKNGDIYYVTNITNKLSTRFDEYPIMVTYVRERDGSEWSRPLELFYKFRTPLPDKTFWEKLEDFNQKHALRFF